MRGILNASSRWSAGSSDLTVPKTLAPAVAGGEAIVFTHGSDGGGQAGAERVDYGGVRNVLAALAGRTPRIALMTAIGVTNRAGVLADRSEASANAAAEVLGNAGYEVSVATVDVSSREAVHALVAKATGIGDIVGLIQAVGVSPSQAPPETVVHVVLFGTAVVLEEFGSVVAAGRSGVVISSQSGHRLPR